MASVRLRQDQIQRLRESGDASAIIRHAVRRWKRGDFVIGSKPKRKRGDELLQIFPLWKKLDGVEDWQLRAILDQHWAIKDEVLMKQCDAEIAYWDRIVKEMMGALPTCFIENATE